MIGIDLIRVGRVAKLAKSDTMNKVFTKAEVEYAKSKSDVIQNDKRYTKSDETFAGMFCAKEAFLKALGLGLGQLFVLNEIEVSHTNQGQPFIVITSKIESVLTENKLSIVNLSISHDGEYATAVVEML